VDVHLFSKTDIVTNDGQKVGSIFIVKTINCKIPILPIVEQIFEKYKDDPLVLNSKLLPVSSNQRTNVYLEIGDIWD
jgi:hypothetical protein